MKEKNRKYYYWYFQMIPYIVICLIGFNHLNFEFHGINLKKLFNITYNSIIIISVSILLYYLLYYIF